MAPNCEALVDMDDFTKYVGILAKQTNFEEARLEVCKNEICIAVYGTGNPDISGIGVAIAYILEFSLSVLLSLAAIRLRKPQSGTAAYRWKEIMQCGLDSFFYSAAYFTLAMQLATIIVLIRKDYGISNADLGAIEARIAQSVSVVSMMPLLYPAALLEPEPEDRNENRDVRHNSRLLLLSVTLALSFFPFLSRCMHAFGPSPIGDGSNSKVSDENWAKVASMCFTGGFADLKDDMTWKALPGLELTASLTTYLFAFWLLSGLPNTRYIPDKDTKGHRGVEKILSWRERVAKWFEHRRRYAIVPLLALIGFTIPLIVMIFTLRDLQKQLADYMNHTYEGDDWGFGQIVSIVLFVPVGVDMAYWWRFGSSYER
ncbi:hypothetical protein NCS57_00702500 [Fusarium keratoplasticum]|uniref:Uncharacterized protein n=1 Tax=Fusarium keratoplasticum TaxID=1328300 RepID=A0ACC0QX30_9HYPO|nr:hypothetical protein NCS57_00702500 [Fusarium keratoplasticum]KAI8668893.1 hypothetical protein NCS57_00702500 [Fusarium keratoplasticum]